MELNYVALLLPTVQNIIFSCYFAQIILGLNFFVSLLFLTFLSEIHTLHFNVILSELLLNKAIL
jgi:hypothetical protein